MKYWNIDCSCHIPHKWVWRQLNGFIRWNIDFSQWCRLQDIARKVQQKLSTVQVTSISCEHDNISLPDFSPFIMVTCHTSWESAHWKCGQGECLSDSGVVKMFWKRKLEVVAAERSCWCGMHCCWPGLRSCFSSGVGVGVGMITVVATDEWTEMGIHWFCWKTKESSQVKLTCPLKWGEGGLKEMGHKYFFFVKQPSETTGIMSFHFGLTRRELSHKPQNVRI